MTLRFLTCSRGTFALLAAIAVAVGVPVRAHANPQGGTVAAGIVDIHVTPKVVDVHQHSDKAVIDWRSFDIDADETTNFHQPSANAVALNRVHSSQASVINGALNANGNVIVVNQNGILFGRNARVDVNGLVATTADIDNDKFMTQTNPAFDKPGNPNAAVINQGQITARDSGLVGFVAPRVENDGVITARLGRVHLASGDKATIDFYGDGLLEVAVSDNVRHQLVKNTGAIHAAGGTVALTAAAGNQILSSAIEVGGDVNAQAVAQQGGRIVIAGLTTKNHGISTAVKVTGKLDVSGTQVSQKGGKITVAGDKIRIASTAQLDASGHSGGGVVKVGGDYHGSGATPVASQLIVERGANIRNDAIALGNGGDTVLWSDGATDFAGFISIRGGLLGGNGGFVEVSGKNFLGYRGLVDTRAPKGRNGTLLLDPADLTISNLADSDITASSPFDSTGAASSNLNVGTLVAALGMSNVVISTASGTGGFGDITFVDPVVWNSGFSLTANADRHIFVNAAITNSGTGGITLNANTAGSNITVAAPISTGGALNLSAAQDLLIQGGLTSGGTMNLTASGRDLISNSSGIINAVGSLTTSSGRDTSFGANATSGGNLTSTAARDLTVNAGTTLTNGAGSAMSLQAAGGSTAGTGNLTLNGNLNAGTGSLTLVSGINGTRPSWTATTTNLLRQGGTFGAVNISGFLNLTIDRALNSSGAVSLIANNTGGTITVSNLGSVLGTVLAFNSALDTTINGAVDASSTLGFTSGQDVIIGTTGSTHSTGNTTLTVTRDFLLNGSMDSDAGLTEAVTRDILMGSGSSLDVVGAITFGGRDITLANVTSGGNISATATRDLTTRAGTTVTTGAAGSLTLYAANNVVTGTGNLTLNGILNVGTGGLNLTSGVNGTRPSMTFTTANLLRQGATFGATTITGFLDTVINRDLNSSGNISITSFRDLTLGATYTVTPGAANNLSLLAANNVVTGTGNLYLNGIINAGTGTTTLLSGVNGTRPNYTMTTTNFLRQGATFGATTITGFLDTTIDRDLNSSGSISINSFRDLNINATRTLTSGAAGGITLTAANNVVAGTGNLNLNGTLRSGTGALTLTSGVNGTRPNLTMNGTNIQRLGATYGAMTITGFLDTFINDNLISSGTISITSFRDLTLNAANSITTGTTGALTLRAANNVVVGTGNLYLNGNMNVGSGGLTLLSGINGTRPDLTFNTVNLVPNNTNFGAVSITGFRDITVNRNMTSTAGISINAYRDLTINASRTVTTGATGALSLTAANNVVTSAGNLNLNGTIGAGSGGLTLLSGVNGTRPDWTADSTTLLQNGASFGVVSIQGFRDLTINRSIPGTTGVTLLSYRDLNINAGNVISTGATGAMSLRAAGGVVGGTGRLTINGELDVGTGALTLLSGINGTRPTWTADSTSLTRLGATFGAINVQGFADFIIDRPLNSTSTITFSNNTRTTLSDDVTTSAASAITFSNPVYIAEGVTSNVTSANGNITFGSTIDDTVGGADEALVVNAGTANVTFSGAINGLGLTVNGATLTFPAAIGATRAMKDVSITSANALALPAITGRSIFARSTGATADITIAAGRVLTSSATGNAIVLASGRNFINNSGAGALALTGGGRYIIYSVNPGSDTSGGLAYDQRRFSCAFASPGTCAYNATINSTIAVPASGNIFLYSSTPILLAVIPQAIANIIYGSAAPNLVNYAYAPFTLASGYLNASDLANDIITGSINGQTNYTQGSGVGSYNISYLSGDLVSSLGYGFDYQTLNNAFSVLPRHVTVDLTGTAGKVYDGTNVATLSGTNYTINNIYSGDLLTLGVGYSSAAYNDKNVGSGKTVTVNGLSLTGAVSANYVLDNTTAVAGVGTITPRALTITGVAPNKVYDATALSSATLNDDRVAGDVLTLGYGSSLFSDKNAGNGKTVTVSGITLGGADAGNYTYNTSASTTANITPAVLTVSASGLNKVYNGNNLANFTFGDDRIAGDVLTLGYGSALFSDKNVGNGKTITVSGITLGGADAGNYTYNTSATTSANITPAALTIGASGINRVYNGNNLANFTFGDDRIAGDVLTLGYGSALFSDKNVGNGKTITVSGITLGGADAGNYTYNTSATTTANITPAVLTVSASGLNKVYNGNNLANLTFGDDRIAGDVLTFGYGSALFGDKNVGNGKTITVSGITLGGADAGNYTYNTSATTTANITPAVLTIGTTASNKVYDGTANAAIVLNDDRIAGDVLTFGYGSALFGDKNVGNGKTVTVSGITLSGADAGNYTYNTSASTTANITPAVLTIGTTASNKVYDGTANAAIVLNDDRIAGDVLTIGYGSSLFNNKNAGTGKTVTVSGITLSGADAGNYTYNTSASTTANITPRALVVSTTGVNKIYDGSANAGIVFGDNRIAGDVLTFGYGSSLFSDKNAGNGKTITVSGITLGGADAGNYTYNTSATTTANISRRVLVITAAAADKLYDGTAAATVTLSDNRVLGDILTINYGSASFPDDAIGTNRVVTVSGLSLAGTDSGNYTTAASITTTASIYSTFPPPPPPPPVVTTPPNTVVKVSQNTSSLFVIATDDGIYATPSLGYELVYLPPDAPSDNRVRNKPIRAGIGVPILEPAAFYGEIDEI